MARVLVRATLPGGHRKIGRMWPASDTEAEVSDAELETLKACPALIVVLLPEGAKNVSTRPAPTAAATEDAEYAVPEDDGPVRKKRGKG